MIADIFDRLADQYERFERAPIHERVKARVFAILKKELAPGSSIADIGSGPGTYAIPLAQEGFRVTAIDVSPKMLERLRTDATRAGVTIEAHTLDASQNLDAIPTQDAAISVHGPLNYRADPLPMIHNIATRVRPGGLLILALSRAAAIEQIARDPLRTLRMFTSKESIRVDSTLAGENLAVYLHDPRKLAQRLEVIERSAIGLSKHFPAALDAHLGRARGLRNLGATSLLIIRNRT